MGATRTVRVRADVDAAQAVKTLAHEAGHVLLHDPADFTLPPGGAGISRTATTPGTPTGAGATTAQCRGVREVEAESVAYLVAATHGLPTDDYTFAYVTGWAAGVDRAEPERVVRDTGVRVLAAGRAVLAGTQPEATAAGAELAAGAQAGTERAAAARAHAVATLALAQPAAADPAAAAAEVEALARLHADAAAFYAAQLAAGSPDAARAAALLTARAVPAASWAA